MDRQIVTVVGASGSLGSKIVKAVLDRGAQVRAIVRPTTNRTKLEALGVKDFVVADLRDRASLLRALSTQPLAQAVIASAAGFSAHSAQTKGDNSRTDTQGYRDLVDATKNAGVPRFILISIIECDKATKVPHFYQKYMTETYLAAQGQPYLALRAGAFLDRAQDVVVTQVQKGIFPDIAPNVAMSMIYTPDLARCAAQAALEVPESALNQSVDICCDVPATGPLVAKAFTHVLGRPVVAKPVFSPLLFALLPLVAWLIPSLRDQFAVLKWLRKGGYISHDTRKQKTLFGIGPTIEDSVARYCHDRGLQ